MGELDDAIRQHLALKRQRGASENEIEQLEREVLGSAVPTLAARDEPVVAESAALEPLPALDRGPPATTKLDALDQAETGDLGGSDDGEDVLEAIPDFLAETPEHDRLWFEQQPPRAFDFDD